MITNPEEWMKFEDDFNANNKIDFVKKIEMFEKMEELARELKTFPRKNPLEGIEHKILLAKILNSHG